MERETFGRGAGFGALERGLVEHHVGAAYFDRDAIADQAQQFRSS